MFVDFSESGEARRGSWTELPADEALILWSLRRLVVAWPRCRAVEIALHRRWGDDGLGVEHLLRCWLSALAGHARHPLTVGDPACALLLPDEGAILFVLRHAENPDRARPALAALCGSEGTAVLLPLAAALGGFISSCSPGHLRSAPGSASWAACPASGNRLHSGRAG